MEMEKCEICGMGVEDIVYACDGSGREICWDCEEELAGSVDGFAKYCCGNIYEEGEEVCLSCGDFL
ncbi:hypothetical protein [Rothia sp. L_38]|uniref:hypothetical protein n=1 Tax=Rothia sp. L_38 TaxID=3422315 RepID=UPI003D6A7FF5